MTLSAQVVAAMPNQCLNKIPTLLIGRGRKRQDPDASVHVTRDVPHEFHLTDPASASIMDDALQKTVHVCQGRDHQQPCLQHDEKLYFGHAVDCGKVEVALP